MIRVTIYNEYKHEREIPSVREVYPDGIHGCIAGFLNKCDDMEVRHIATFEDAEHGLTKDVLDDTDVLIFWSHALQEQFDDGVAARVVDYVNRGMGLIALHSAHYSKVMRELLGTGMTLAWRDDESERITVSAPKHPIAQGIPNQFDLVHEEMYCEYFDIPAPDEVVFMGAFPGGEVFRTGCTFTRGDGKIFYFQPGHEEYPIYHTPVIQRIIANAVSWCAGYVNQKSAPAEYYVNRNIRTDRWKLSVFWDHIREAAQQTGGTILQMAQEAAAAGIAAVDLRLTDLLEDEAGVKSALDEAKLAVSCLWNMYDWSTSPSVDEAKLHVDKAAWLGAKRILVVPGFLSEADADELKAKKTRAEIFDFMDKSTAVQNMKEVLSFMTKYASAKGVTVTLEDFDGHTAAFARADELLWFMQNVPGLKYTLDMGNFAYSDEDVCLGYQMLQEYIAHVHCKDRGAEPGYEKCKNSKGLAAVPVGEGYLPIGELVKKLTTKGYEGYFAIEHFGAADQLEYMKKSAEYLRGLR